MQCFFPQTNHQFMTNYSIHVFFACNEFVSSREYILKECEVIIGNMGIFPRQLFCLEKFTVSLLPMRRGSSAPSILAPQSLTLWLTLISTTINFIITVIDYEWTADLISGLHRDRSSLCRLRPAYAIHFHSSRHISTEPFSLHSISLCSTSVHSP